MSEFDERYIKSGDELRLYYRRYPGNTAGVPVVCLHGITRNCRDFEDLAPHLSGRHTVITPDLRGRGRSARDPEWRNYQPRTYVGDVLRLLDELHIGRAALLGTSLGGLVSMILAAEHSERVAGVVLNDIGPEIGPVGLARISGYIGRVPAVANWDEAYRQVREIYELAWPGLAEDTWRRIARRGYRENDEGAPVLDMDPKIGDAAREVGTGLADPWALFRDAGKRPMLVLQGELSDILTDDIIGRMQQANPDLRHVSVANRGHVPLLDEPDSLAAIDEFLERLT